MNEGRITLVGFFLGLIGAVVGAVVYPILFVPRAIWHWPKIAFRTYRAIWYENKIGRNVKIAIFATLWIIVLIFPVAVLVGSICYGFAICAYKGAFDHMQGIKKQIKRDTSWVDDFLVSEMLVELGHYCPDPLPKGEKPFEIPVEKCIEAIISSLLMTVYVSPFLLIVTLLWLPGVYLRTLYSIVTDGEQFLLGLLLVILVTIGIVLAVPLVPVGSAGFSVFHGCYFGYKKGILKAFSEAIDVVQEWFNLLKEYTLDSD